MKIAHVVSQAENIPPTAKNGLEFVVSWLIEGLVQRGHKVTLFAPAASTTHTSLQPLIAKGITLQKIPEVSKTIICASIWNTVYATTRAHTFDIIHFHNDAAYSVPFLSLPIVQTLHHPFEHEFLAPLLQEKLNLPYLQFIFDQYQKVNFVAVSKKQEELFRNSAGQYYFKKSQTIYNGIPVQDFPSSLLPGKYLLYLGYINKEKGADTAVRVAKALNKKLILAGSAYGQEAFFNEHIQPYLNETIQYVGPVDFTQKVKLYCGAEALLAPLSWHEPFGLTLIEAQACGTPTIAFNKGAAREVIAHGKTGFVVETEKEMVQAVDQISLLDRGQIRGWVESNFSVDNMVGEYENLYGKLITEYKNNQ